MGSGLAGLVSGSGSTSPGRSVRISSTLGPISSKEPASLSPSFSFAQLHLTVFDNVLDLE